jgi:cellulose synthase (UDP-forming)
LARPAIKKIKRQWGAEKRTLPLPTVHDKPSTRKMTLSRLAIVASVSLWVTYVISTIIRQFFEGPHSFSFTMQAFGYLVVVTFLTFSALMYLVARQGALQRFAKHVRVPRAEIDQHFADHQPSITVLVPSYSEEPGVVRKTLLSAALQEYPKMRVVLLIDDKPYPTDPATLERLDEARSLGKDIMQLLAEPRARFNAALGHFERNRSKTALVSTIKVRELAGHYEWAAAWLEQTAQAEAVDDHVDEFFCEQVLRGLGAELKLMAEALNASCDEGIALSADRVLQLYRRLAWIFDCQVSVFERKKYASLSHEANKAMNLNSYLGLMGASYTSRPTPDGPVLVPADRRAHADITIPDSDFLLTLDADSILLRDYCLRLVYFLQQPGNERVAVTQTPYSSFRGAATRIERLAGATTDIPIQRHLLGGGQCRHSQKSRGRDLRNRVGRRVQNKALYPGPDRN